MIISNQDLFSDGQAITATAPSTNVLDIGAAGTPFGAPAAIGRDIGKAGGEVLVDVRVTQAFNTLTSLKVSLEVSDDNSTFVEVASRTYLLAELGIGQLGFPARLPEGVNKRYLRLNYTVAGSNPTLGKLFAAIVPGRQTQ